MLICILTKNVITSCSVTMMLFLHLEVKPLMTLTTVLYLSCALISGHLAMMLMELTKRRSEERRVGKEGRVRGPRMAAICEVWVRPIRQASGSWAGGRPLCAASTRTGA